MKNLGVALLLCLALVGPAQAGASASASWTATFVVEDLDLGDGIGASMFASTYQFSISSPHAGVTCCPPHPVEPYFRPLGSSVGVTIQPFPPNNYEFTEVFEALAFTLTPNTRLAISGNVLASAADEQVESTAYLGVPEQSFFRSFAGASVTVQVPGRVAAISDGDYVFILETGPTEFASVEFTATFDLAPEKRTPC